ncbi:MAG: citrate lyase subunit alpha [Bacillota bacterium]
MINAVGRDVPDSAVVLGTKVALRPYQGAFATRPAQVAKTNTPRFTEPGRAKVIGSIQEALDQVGLRDGMTISFHHHLRLGDAVIETVLREIAKRGVRDLTFTASGLHPVTETLMACIREGVITRIHHGGMLKELGALVAQGALKEPCVIRTHGGRARAIESGELPIDVAFVAAPTCDTYGNATGIDGPSACGALGYGIVDARSARRVVAITDNLVPYPLHHISIPQTTVDCIVTLDRLGDPSLIASGAIKRTKNPRDLLIADQIGKVIEHSGLLKPGFSMQAGSGGISLAVTRKVTAIMREKGIQGSFMLGGITAVCVDLLKEGLFHTLLDVQSFDLEAARSVGKTVGHVEIDSSFYANPHTAGCAVNMVDVAVLSALEVDSNFNVNVLTGFDGVIMTGPGGHSDTSAGSKLAIIGIPLVRNRVPCVVDHVGTVVTPGETVDVVVTEYGVAVNPRRTDLLNALEGSSLRLVDMRELVQKARDIAGVPERPRFTKDIVALVEYRDGTIIDVVRKPDL